MHRGQHLQCHAPIELWSFVAGSPDTSRFERRSYHIDRPIARRSYEPTITCLLAPCVSPIVFVDFVKMAPEPCRGGPWGRFTSWREAEDQQRNASTKREPQTSTSILLHILKRQHDYSAALTAMVASSTAINIGALGLIMLILQI